MFRSKTIRSRRWLSALAIALLALQTAAPTAQILHEIRHVDEAWDSIPSASAALTSAARGGCSDERPEQGNRGPDDEDEETCELCGFLAPLRIFSDTAVGSAYVAEQRPEAVAYVAATPEMRLVATDGDPRGPPARTS